MGFNETTLQFVMNAINSTFGSCNGLSMLEYGDQMVRANGNQPAKLYFQSLGVNHVSIDLNGLFGALPMDLSKPLGDDFHDKFDIVTNSGTTEHIQIDGQYECFKNAHLCCRIGGLMIHVVPKCGQFIKSHGYVYYSKGFFNYLASVNGYKSEIGELPWSAGRHTGTLITAVLHKTRSSFAPHNPDFLVGLCDNHNNSLKKSK